MLLLGLFTASVLLLHLTDHALKLILIRIVALRRLLGLLVFFLLRLLLLRLLLLRLLLLRLFSLALLDLGLLNLGGGLGCLGLRGRLAFRLCLGGRCRLGLVFGGLDLGLLSRLIFSLHLRLLCGLRLLLCLCGLLNLLLELILNLLSSFGGSMAISAAM
ncbi:hypothetical protein HG531_003167 [Fusarium graminearum]|nr:hypothetical protein HG531_003167 [Fusarium graminearum]